MIHRSRRLFRPLLNFIPSYQAEKRFSLPDHIFRSCTLSTMTSTAAAVTANGDAKRAKPSSPADRQVRPTLELCLTVQHVLPTPLLLAGLFGCVQHYQRRTCQRSFDCWAARLFEGVAAKSTRANTLSTSVQLPPTGCHICILCL